MKTYEEIFNHINNCGSNSIAHFSGNREGGYSLQQAPYEWSSLLHYLQDKNVRNYCGVGVCSAGCVRSFCDIIDMENILLMDLGLESYQEIPNLPGTYWENIKNLRRSGWIAQYWGSTQDKSAISFMEQLGAKFHFCFIDGLHTYDGVKNDTYLILNNMSDSSYIGFHDTTLHGLGIDTWIQELKDGVIPGIKHIADWVDNTHPKGVSLFGYNKV